MSLWNIYRLVTEVVENRVKCLRWCVQNGLLPAHKLCSEGHEMVLYEDDTAIGNFLCRKGERRETVCRSKGTIFENSKMPPEKVVLLIYCFATDFPYSTAVRESSLDGEETSRQTVRDYYYRCKEIIVNYLLERTYDDKKIGGVKKIVDLHECELKIRKRSVLRKRGTCVLSIVERDSDEFRVHLCPENEHSEDATISFIKKCVAEGSTIVTEKWSSYTSLTSDGFFVPQTLKHSPKNSKLPDVYSHFEYLFKNDLKKSKQDVFEAMIDLIKWHYSV